MLEIAFTVLEGLANAMTSLSVIDLSLKIIKRSIILRNSRIFPVQGRLHNSFNAAGVISFTGTPYSLQISSQKFLDNKGMSSTRSVNEGT
ncbi:hypothetical protein D3C72_2109250 [compost metagenome]